MEFTYCNRCVMPNTKPGIKFDADGVCSACRSVELKHQVDWEARAGSLAALADEVRGTNGNGYDVLVPVSGGKDSSFQTYMMSSVHKLKTLCVCVAPHLQTPEGIENLNALVEKHDVDLLKIAVRPGTHKAIRRLALFKIGNPSYTEHRVVFSAVAQAALLYNVPLVVWGEDIAAEFGGNILDAGDGSADELINNDLFRETSFDDLIGGEINRNELFFYDHPDKRLLRQRRIRSVYLSHFHWWDGRKHYYKAQDFGFRGLEVPLSGNVLGYDNIDEKLCEVHIWFKFLKFGFWRPTDAACYLIWNGYWKREQAVEVVNAKRYEPPAFVPEFCEFHGITEDELWACAEQWRNHDIWHRVNGQWRLRRELT